MTRTTCIICGKANPIVLAMNGEVLTYPQGNYLVDAQYVHYKNVAGPDEGGILDFFCSVECLVLMLFPEGTDLSVYHPSIDKEA